MIVKNALINVHNILRSNQLNKFRPFFASRFLVYVMYVVLLNPPINSEIKCANGSILVGQLTNEEKPYRE